MKCEFLTVFPWKMIGNLHVLVGTSNGLVSPRERDVTLAWRRQSGHRKSGPIPRDLTSSTDVPVVLLNHSNNSDTATHNVSGHNAQLLVRIILLCSPIQIPKSACKQTPLCNYMRLQIQYGGPICHLDNDIQPVITPKPVHR